MATLRRRTSALFLVALPFAPLLTNGCSSSPIDAICCSDFKPGADMSQVQFIGDAQVNGQFVAFAQAAGDIAAVASGAVGDVTGACTAIATDLGDDPAAGAGKSGVVALDFWCGEAIAKLDAAAGGSLKGQLSILADPPSCSASIQAQGTCQARCDTTGSCNVRATPPVCTGGTLEISCKGNCTGSATAPTIDCTGSCSGTCTGTCDAAAGASVDCDGRCNGTCAAKAGIGTGIQVDGSCQGTCSGSCAVKADAKLSCTGTCAGKCEGSCRATPGQASVTCSGACDADYQPLSCEGGKLEGGCNVDAKCQANCNASVSAKGECRPPRVAITATGTGQALATVAATLEKTLPALLVVARARGQAFVDLAGPVAQGAVTIAASGKLDVKGTACMTAAVASAGQAAADFGGAFDQAGKVILTVGL